MCDAFAFGHHKESEKMKEKRALREWTIGLSITLLLLVGLAFLCIKGWCLR